MKKVIVLSGVSGSGKSTYAKKILNDSSHGNVAIVSADDYFMIGGKYQFDPLKLSWAHGECFRKFLLVIDRDGRCSSAANIVVVDNTNTTSEEIAPYMLGAQAFGWEAEIRTMSVSP